MMFISLAEVCPELAQNETMGIQILPSPGSVIPAGTYFLIELYCSNQGCDCRRVMFLITNSETEKTMAIINWGWEKRSFYEAWYKYGDKEDIDEMKGPSLEWNSPTGAVAEEFLAIIASGLIKKRDFVNTVKRHYKVFRKGIDSDKVIPDTYKRLATKPQKQKISSSEKGKNTGVDGFVFRVDLRHIKPPIWRRIWVPTDYTLFDLHRLIQITLGWSDCHLHCFVISGREYGDPDPDYGLEDVISEYETTLKSVIRRVKQKFRYDYDFGDGWEHDIVLERREMRNSRTPVLLKGKRACPPEDCGGEYGYWQIIKAQRKAKAGEKLTESEKDYLEWMDHEFDPEEFDAEAINRTLSKM